MIVFTVVFGSLAEVSTQGVPYPVFTFAALVPWALFSQGLAGASNSLLSNAQLVSKVYFPRLIIPLASACSYLVDFSIALGVFFVLMIYYDIQPTISMLAVIPLTFLTLACALGIGIWFSALNVRYRDIRHVIPFMLQVLLYISPIPYSSSQIGGEWRTLYLLNPLVGIAEGFRWALLGVGSAPKAAIAFSVALAATLLVAGLAYFKHAEQSFADVI